MDIAAMIHDFCSDTITRIPSRPIRLLSLSISLSRVLRLGILALFFSASAFAQLQVNGNEILLPTDGWYQVQNATTYDTVCEGVTTCSVASGSYIVVNHTTGERFEAVTVSGDAAGSSAHTGTVSVDGRRISWPDDGWYQVQDANSYETVCEGGSSCEAEPGAYRVINHSTGERFENVVVAATNPATHSSNTGVRLEGSFISWPDDGWYQVQNAKDYSTLCEGGRRCEVPVGSYIVINHTTGERHTVDMAANTSNSAPCDGLVHPNGQTYCVAADRTFAAYLADGTLWWSFLLPGENASNRILDVVAIGDNVALIAELTDESENQQLEMSLFEQGGEFVDTRDLLPLPETDQFVSICSNADLCTTTLATHVLERNPLTLDWRFDRNFEHEFPLGSSAVNEANFHLLLDSFRGLVNQSYFWTISGLRSEFHDLVATDFTVVSDPDRTLVAKMYGMTEAYPETFEIADNAFTLSSCPHGGFYLNIHGYEVRSVYDQCQWQDWTLHGSYTSFSAHQSSSTSFVGFSVEREGTMRRLTASRLDSGSNGFNGGLTVTAEQYSRESIHRTTRVTNLDDRFQWAADRGGTGLSGYSGTTQDGRTGYYNFDGADLGSLEVSYQVIDSLFNNTPIDVSVSLERRYEYHQFWVAGSALPNQTILLTLMTPSGVEIDRTFTIETRDDTAEYPFWTSGDITFVAQDDSRMVITQLRNQLSTLGRLQLFSPGNDNPSFESYVNIADLIY